MSFKSRERYWKDRRRHPRKRVVWPATLETVRGKIPCRVSNISPGGARLRVDEPVLVGEYVTLAIPAHGEFDGVVAWQRDSVIGMQFGDYELRAQHTRLVANDTEPLLDITDPPSGEIADMARPSTLTAALPDVDRIPLEPSIRWPEDSELPAAASPLAALAAVTPAFTSMTGTPSADGVEEKAERLTHGPHERIRTAIAASHPEINALIDAKAAARLTRADLADHSATW